LDNRCLLYSAGDAPAAFFDAEGRSELSAQSEEPQNSNVLIEISWKIKGDVNICQWFWKKLAATWVLSI
jgi:hypothetical protein